MQAYIIRRVLLLIPTLLGITFVVFMAVRFIPGSVVDQMLADTDGTPETRARLEKQYGLGGNIPLQYVEWLGDLARGDLGDSIISRRPITEVLGQRLPATVQLGILALIIGQLVAIPVGIISAIRQDTAIDYVARSTAILFLAVPSFWLALMVITYGYRWFGWTPPLRYADFWDNPVANLQTMWVPALVLGTGLSGTVMRLTRSTMLEVLRQDYVRTAWSKGLQERAVISRHVIRNAMIPVITVIGLQVPFIVGGTVIIEQIFSIPGMGTFLLESVNRRDYPAVQALVLISAIVILLSNLVVDLTYPFIDPRIKYS